MSPFCSPNVKNMTSQLADRCALLLALAFAASASPSLAQDIDRGQRLAGAWCASCHAVEPNQGTSDLAPAFELIANDPAKDDAQLRGWLVAPHPPMPDFNLSKDEYDLIGYIGSLRTE